MYSYLPGNLLHRGIPGTKGENKVTYFTTDILLNGGMPGYTAGGASFNTVSAAGPSVFSAGYGAGGSYGPTFAMGPIIPGYDFMFNNCFSGFCPGLNINSMSNSLDLAVMGALLGHRGRNYPKYISPGISLEDPYVLALLADALNSGGGRGSNKNLESYSRSLNLPLPGGGNLSEKYKSKPSFTRKVADFTQGINVGTRALVDTVNNFKALGDALGLNKKDEKEEGEPPIILVT